MSRYDIPDPRCQHVRKGIVWSGDFDDPKSPLASTQVCAREACIEDAKEWAFAKTRLPAQHRADVD